MNKKISGFTLTELMAVVIIVAILSGIAAGTYRKAVERSHLSDGLGAAAAMMEAVNRFYLENVLTAGNNAVRPLVSHVDISFPNQRACTANTTNADYCVKTKYFEVIIYAGYVDAVRTKNNTVGDYTMRVYSSEFGSNTRRRPVCVFSTDTGRDLCVSAGYSSCNTNSECSKP